MPKIIAGSSNISVLESRLHADQCEGKLKVDVTPSTLIGGGAANVLGVKVRVKNPLGIVIRDFGSDYDILPPLTGEFAINIPTVASKYQAGVYLITVELTDSDAKKYTLEKPVEVCVIESVLSASIKGICIRGIVSVLVNQPPVYKGKIASSKSADLVLSFPTNSGVDSKEITVTNFSDLLFEGVYQVKGTICAFYNLGDNVFASVLYRVFADKDIKCGLDESCFLLQLKTIHDQLSSGCVASERERLTLITVDALRLYKTAELAIQNGDDASEYISELEDLLGFKCTCNAIPGTPFIGSPLAGSSTIINGCGVTHSQDGLTTTYTIDNYEYIIEVEDNNDGMLSIGPSVVVDGECIKKQIILLDKAKVYQSVLGQATENAEDWAEVINDTFSEVPSCFDLVQQDWDSLTLNQKFALIYAKLCSVASCSGQISGINSSVHGRDVTITFTMVRVLMADVYLDDTFVTSVLGTATGVTIEGAADGILHQVKVYTKDVNGRYCANGAASFRYFACVTVAPPQLTSNSVSDAQCPFDLTSLLPVPLPSGFSVEWYDDQDRRPGSRVSDPVRVQDGHYFAFYKNAEGCYSVGTRVLVSCATHLSCTAPQNLSAVPTFDGNALIRFDSAAYPPAGNEYTVRRRLFTDPDDTGSYITLPAPIYNMGLDKWEVIDNNSPADNTLYVYMAESNCGATSPRTSAQFSFVVCPHLTFTVSGNAFLTSFLSTGGNVTRYRVRYVNSVTGEQILPYLFNAPFSGPIAVEGVNVYESYNIYVDVYVSGILVKTCEYTWEAYPRPAYDHATFKLADPEGNVCDSPDVELYYQGPLEQWTVLRSSAGGSPVSGTYSLVRFPDGSIHNISFGTVGTPTGDNC